MRSEWRPLRVAVSMPVVMIVMVLVGCRALRVVVWTAMVVRVVMVVLMDMVMVMVMFMLMFMFMRARFGWRMLVRVRVGVRVRLDACLSCIVCRVKRPDNADGRPMIVLSNKSVYPGSPARLRGQSPVAGHASRGCAGPPKK